jgi:beta-galactosidase
VHSNCDEVELFLNGQSHGRQSMPRNGHLEWKVAYAPGTLTARGYRDGQEVATAERKTTGAPVRVKLCPHHPTLCTDGEDVAVVTAAVVDADGLLVPTASNLVRFAVDENATILGVGNGDPSCHEPDKASQRSVFNGLCQVIVQGKRGASGNEVVLSAASEGLEPARLALKAESCEARPYVPSR